MPTRRWRTHAGLPSGILRADAGGLGASLPDAAGPGQAPRRRRGGASGDRPARGCGLHALDDAAVPGHVPGARGPAAQLRAVPVPHAGLRRREMAPHPALRPGALLDHPHGDAEGRPHGPIHLAARALVRPLGGLSVVRAVRRGGRRTWCTRRPRLGGSGVPLEALAAEHGGNVEVGGDEVADGPGEVHACCGGLVPARPHLLPAHGDGPLPPNHRPPGLHPDACRVVAMGRLRAKPRQRRQVRSAAVWPPRRPCSPSDSPGALRGARRSLRRVLEGLRAHHAPLPGELRARRAGEPDGSRGDRRRRALRHHRPCHCGPRLAGCVPVRKLDQRSLAALRRQ
mmetsp:Transcript_71569/g.207457  ORF Transcript_71569/g.207457 Transcript_71569/m.207457 type:complete len:341 (+) Transcript_71569:368-1390(+)